jgi:hypothetical protein
LTLLVGGFEGEPLTEITNSPVRTGLETIGVLRLEQFDQTCLRRSPLRWRNASRGRVVGPDFDSRWSHATRLMRVGRGCRG